MTSLIDLEEPFANREDLRESSRFLPRPLSLFFSAHYLLLSPSFSRFFSSLYPLALFRLGSFLCHCFIAGWRNAVRFASFNQAFCSFLLLMLDFLCPREESRGANRESGCVRKFKICQSLVLCSSRFPPSICILSSGVSDFHPRSRSLWNVSFASEIFTHSRSGVENIDVFSPYLPSVGTITSHWNILSLELRARNASHLP